MKTYIDTKKRAWRVPCGFGIDSDLSPKKRRALERRLLPGDSVPVNVAPLLSLDPVLIAPGSAYKAFALRHEPCGGCYPSPRRLSDLLPNEERNRSRSASVTRHIWRMLYGQTPSMRMLLGLYEEFKEDIAWAVETLKAELVRPLSPVVAAFACAHSVRDIAPKVETLARELVSGIWKRGSVALALHKACECYRLNERGRFGAVDKLQRRVLRGIQLYCEGKPAYRLMPPPKGLNWLRREYRRELRRHARTLRDNATQQKRGK